MLKIKPDIVCGMAWKNANGITNVQKVIMEMGLVSSLKIQGYWNLLSDESNGHVCGLYHTPMQIFWPFIYPIYIKRKDSDVFIPIS